METKHINHVVLYAKNFYRHTGDLVKDLQRFCQIDGIPYYRVNTPEKLLATMIRNYKTWIYSLSSKQEKSRFLKELSSEKFGVDWCSDPVVSKLWNILIVYSGGYIKLRDLSKPAYDKYHLPQYRVSNHLFDKKDSFETMIDKADKFMHETQLTVLDRNVNKILDELDYRTIIDTFNVIGGDLAFKDSQEVEDEIWEAYENAVEDHKDGDDIKREIFSVETPHFILDFYLDKGLAEVDLNLKYCEVSKEIEYAGKNLTIKACSDVISLFMKHDFSDIVNGPLNEAKKINTYNIVSSDIISEDEITKALINIDQFFIANPKYRFTNNNYFAIKSCGCRFDVRKVGNILRGKVIIDEILSCAIQDQELINNKSIAISDEKY